MIKRSIAKEFNQLQSDFPVVGIIGPRQVGKTTFARGWAASFSSPYVYLDLEDQRDLAKLTDPDTYFEDHSKYTILIDEIQEMPELFKAIRVAVDRDRTPGKFVILGSASPVLMRRSADSLAGRVAYCEMHPLHLRELPDQVPNSGLWFRGGMPDALLATNDSSWQTWMANYVKSYVERDLPQLGLVASPRVIYRLLRMIRSIHGNLLNIASLARSMQIDQRTLKSYLDYLEDAFIIRRLEPFYSNIRKRLVKAPKIFIRDSGVLHYLADFQNYEDLRNHELVGNSWEGFVIQQIIPNLKKEVSPYFFRTQDGAELDLLCCVGEKPIAAIEVKLTNAPKLSRSFTTPIEALNPALSILVTPAADGYRLNPDILVCNPNSMLEELGRVGLIK